MDKDIQDQLKEYLADIAKQEEDFEKYASFITKELKELGLEFEFKKSEGSVKNYVWRINSYQSRIMLSGVALMVFIIRDQVVNLTPSGNFFDDLDVLPANAFEYKCTENRISILLNKIKNRERI